MRQHNWKYPKRTRKRPHRSKSGLRRTNLDLLLAAGTADESRLKSDIAYRDAIQAGATAGQAAAISANTLAADTIRAAQAADQMAQSFQDAANAAYDAALAQGSFSPDLGGSGTYSQQYGTISAGSTPQTSGGATGNFVTFDALSQMQKRLDSLSSTDMANIQLQFGGGVNGAISSLQGGAFGAGARQDNISTVDNLYQLRNAQTNDNNVKVSNLNEEMAWLQSRPETIARDQQIVSLQHSIDQLKTATDSNTAATQATLNPLYSQGHGALAIGYYHAANGLDGVVGGSGGTDSQAFHAMLTPGERVTVTPPGQAANSNAASGGPPVVNNVFNIGNGTTSTSRRSARQVAQGFAQSIAALR